MATCFNLLSSVCTGCVYLHSFGILLLAIFLAITDSARTYDLLDIGLICWLSTKDEVKCEGRKKEGWGIKSCLIGFLTSSERRQLLLFLFFSYWITFVLVSSDQPAGQIYPFPVAQPLMDKEEEVSQCWIVTEILREQLNIIEANCSP